MFTQEEVAAPVGATMDFWLTLGSEGAAIENELWAFLGVCHSLLVNSGSSANMLTISALTSHKVPDQKLIRLGEDVITVAAGFPSTVAPIVQVEAVPVFIDADPITGNAHCDQLEAASSPGKTKAVMMAHALGNPFDLATALAFVAGTTSGWLKTTAMRWAVAKTAQSFYPPDYLTMGEGGAVNFVADQKLKVMAEGFRDWGHDCWCPSGIDNTCGKRFEWQLGELPVGYDHKYTYSHLGYNLKPLDPQAAIGRVQLRRLPDFIEARKCNWKTLRRGLEAHRDVLAFSLPTHATGWDPEAGFSWDETGCRTDCSWFGFNLQGKPAAPFSRTDLARELDPHRVGNRMLFGSNLVRQPAFVQLRQDQPEALRVTGKLSGSDEIMTDTLFLGSYPGLTSVMLEAEIAVIRGFCSQQ